MYTIDIYMFVLSKSVAILMMRGKMYADKSPTDACVVYNICNPLTYLINGLINDDSGTKTILYLRVILNVIQIILMQW